VQTSWTPNSNYKWRLWQLKKIDDTAGIPSHTLYHDHLSNQTYVHDSLITPENTWLDQTEKFNFVAKTLLPVRFEVVNLYKEVAYFFYETTFIVATSESEDLSSVLGDDNMNSETKYAYMEESAT